MNISNKFIILVGLSHALILIGFGHSGAVAGLTLFFVPDFFSNPDIIDLVLIKTDRLPAIGILSLAGYFILIMTCFNHRKNKFILYFVSMIFLWWSIAYLIVRSDSGEIVYSHPLFYCPFLILSIAPLFWEKLKSQVHGWVKN